MIRIIRAKPAYLKRYGEAFPIPTRVGAYDLAIDNDATSVVRARLEAEWIKKVIRGEIF